MKITYRLFLWIVIGGIFYAFESSCPLQADIVFLKKGGFVEGTVHSLPNTNTVTVVFPGGSMTLDADDIKNIETKPVPQDVFASQLAQAVENNNADQCLEIAQWARAKSMVREFALAIRAALSIDPNNRQAQHLHREHQLYWQHLPNNEPAVQKLLDETGDSFWVLRTQHYRIAYNCSDMFADMSADRLEAVYQVFLDFFGQRNFLPTPLTDRLEVVLFNDRQQFQDYTKQFAEDMAQSAGFFCSKTQRSYFYDALNNPHYRNQADLLDQYNEQIESYRRQVQKNQDSRTRYLIRSGDGEESKLNRMEMLDNLNLQQKQLHQQWQSLQEQYRKMNLSTTVHEAVHQLAYTCGIHSRYYQNPKWLVEGLALFFDAAFDGENIKPDQINADRLKTFRDHITSPDTLTLKQLITSDDLFQPSSSQMHQAYASAWALFYYLAWNHHESLFDYIFDLSLRISDKPYTDSQRIADFEKYFGPIQSLERDWYIVMISIKS